MTRRLALSFALSLLAACAASEDSDPMTAQGGGGSGSDGGTGGPSGSGGDSSSGGSAGTDGGSGTGGTSDGAVDSDIARFQELIANIQMAASIYRDAMMPSASDADPDCPSLHEDYDHQVRPWIDQMMHMADDMDMHMTDHGGGDVADMGCMAAGMMYELDHHDALACTGSDPDADAAEVQRHVDEILDDCAHSWERCEELLGDPDEDATWDFGPMMAGCEDWDGCCSGMMQHCCHGMMSWMHPDCCGE